MIRRLFLMQLRRVLSGTMATQRPMRRHTRRSRRRLKKTILDAVEEGIKWNDGNPEADEEAYKEKQKEIEEVCNPIISKLYQGAGGPPGVKVVPAVLRVMRVRHLHHTRNCKLTTSIIIDSISSVVSTFIKAVNKR